MVYKLIPEIENITFKNNKFSKKGMRITRIPFISLGQFNFLEL